jgi:hypothetical protein
MRSGSFKLFLAAAAGVLSVSAGEAKASQIVGYLGNFDVYNNTPEATDDFELNIPNVSRSSILGTWNSNPHYGAPTITDLPGGAGQFVHYVGRSADITPVGGVEHFGVIMPTFPTGITYQWSRHGVPVGTPELFPQPVVTIVPPSPATPERPETPETVQVEIENQTETEFWVEFERTEVEGEVGLEDLMPDSDLVNSATPFDDHQGARRFRPGDKLVDDNPKGADDVLRSTVQVVRLFESDEKGKQGAPIGTFMTAAVIAATPVSVPEPTGVAVLGLGTTALLARRRRSTVA